MQSRRCYHRVSSQLCSRNTPGGTAKTADVLIGISVSVAPRGNTHIAWWNSFRSLLDAAADATSPLKVAHFSAHDVTVMPAQAAFGLWDGKIMSYAAHLVLEMYRPAVPASAPGSATSASTTNTSLLL